MKNFPAFLKGFKWFVLCFLSIIVLVAAPEKLRQHDFLQFFIILAITGFILFVFFALSFYFNKMAIHFDADDEYAYLTFASGEKVTFLHSEVEKIEITSQKFVFFLSGEQKIYLSRTVSTPGVRRENLSKVKKIYSDILK